MLLSRCDSEWLPRIVELLLTNAWHPLPGPGLETTLPLKISDYTESSTRRAYRVTERAVEASALELDAAREQSSDACAR